jgi:HNH endonuclease
MSVGFVRLMIHDDRTIARFWAKVDRRGPDECWPWTASTVEFGYGQFRLSNPRRVVRAHVVAYEIVEGDRGDLCVCHSCDNPPCCNPGHLWLGTNRENIIDMIEKGRHGLKRVHTGDLNSSAILKSSDIPVIRSLISEGMTNTDIAARFGVTHSMISRIRVGKAWTSVK